nr:LysM peptidoglycan-binding domain-containing protein [Candidatus Krumholzibacteria bacterium]
MMVLLLLATGCATAPAPGPEQALPDLALEENLANVQLFPQTGEEVDTLAQPSVPATPDISLPLGPDGFASLADLEGLWAEALRLGADEHLGLARDHLFVLQNEVDRPLQEGVSADYAAHLASLNRRAWLLQGILAEKEAFSNDPDQADSLLATSYGRLANGAFPDSLVPATGIRLDDLTADLLTEDNQAVRRWIEYFTGKGRRNFQYWLDRKAAVEPLITSILAEYDLPAELIYLSMIESGLSTRAVSSVGAVGPWQFMPGTAKSYQLRVDWWADERRDMELSTRAAANHITMLHEQFGDWALVLAAYNGGHNRLARKIRQHGHDNFWEMRLPSQTTAYVPKFIAAARVGTHPEKYGFETRPQTPLAFDVVKVDDATDLDLIARCAGVDPAVVKDLNPALIRGASPPKSKAYPVKVPAGTGSRALAELRKIPADRRLTWRQHRVQRGETLGHIAKEYGTSVGDIAKLNNLKDVHLIRPGKQLLIPMPAELADLARSRAAEKGHYVPPSGYTRVSYKVQKGDNLGVIARKLGVTVAHLRKVNAIPRKHVIYPGQKLYAYRPGQG